MKTRLIDCAAAVLMASAVALVLVTTWQLARPAEVTTECIWTDGPPEVSDGPY